MVNNEYLKSPARLRQGKVDKTENTHSHDKNTFSLAELESVFCYNSVRPHQKGWQLKGTRENERKIEENRIERI